MTDTGLTVQPALERYNRLFDNAQYMAIAALLAAMLAADLRANRESSRVSDAMNLILCGISFRLSRRLV